MSSDWEDFCDSKGWSYGEDTYDRFIDSLNTKKRKVYIDDETYLFELERAFCNLGSRSLVIENHVFTTFKEAAKAAQKLAIKKQSSFKIFKKLSSSPFTETQEIHIIDDPEMREAIRLVEEHEYVFYPEHPLINPREKDLLYHENGKDWHFVAHPDGTTENVKQEFYSWRALLELRYHQKATRKKIKSSSSWFEYGVMIRQRDEILHKASEQAKAEQTKVYVTRDDSFIECGEHFQTHYMTFTEKQLKKALLDSDNSDSEEAPF